MKKSAVAAAVILCLLLTGCQSWLDGHYVAVTPFREDIKDNQPQIVQVSNYEQLLDACRDMVSEGTESYTIATPDFTPGQIDYTMEMAIRSIMKTDPIGAYIVRDINYEQGTTGGVPAVAVQVQYNSNRAELSSMKKAANMKNARKVISSALSACDAGVVVLVDGYQDMDFAQFVQDYGDENPDIVMEIPAVTVNTYPDFGDRRVVQIQFGYKTNRQTLRSMQSAVQPVFASARLYVNADASEHEKYSQLCSFLVERYQYKVETSITPSYSLLRHGVGDSRAFAVVYAAMCRDAGLECHVVSGTRDGEAHCWNIICDDGIYYHVDLLRCETYGGLLELPDWDMDGYVWDFSSYPECGDRSAVPTEPPVEAAESESSDQEPASEPEESTVPAEMNPMESEPKAE